jgi:hypothetical protein
MTSKLGAGLPRRAPPGRDVRRGEPSIDQRQVFVAEFKELKVEDHPLPFSSKVTGYNPKAKDGYRDRLAQEKNPQEWTALAKLSYRRSAVR